MTTARARRAKTAAGQERLVAVTLDEPLIVRRRPDIEHERSVAIADLLAENRFCLASGEPGPYRLQLGIADDRLVLDVRDADDRPLRAFGLSLKPFRRVVKDYFTICESYNQALAAASPTQLEAIDMGRRGLHNEGSELLRDRLAGKIELDLGTARRLFTLLCVLHIRG